MRPRDRERTNELSKGLRSFEKKCLDLPGIAEHAARSVFIEQLLESEHRVEYAQRLATMHLSVRRCDPADERFDPLRAAVIRARAGDLDEACWLVLLAIHFGKRRGDGWRSVRRIYRGPEHGGPWGWAEVSRNADEFEAWLKERVIPLDKDAAGWFGSHRKYESLEDTGQVVRTYLEWITGAGGHNALIDDAVKLANGDPRIAFDCLYSGMTANVFRFGRLAAFDYLAMLGKLGLAQIEPGSPYLSGSSGPLRGARLLFGEDYSPSQLDDAVIELGTRLNLGMQVLEDALCNWQKSPQYFKPFRS